MENIKKRIMTILIIVLSIFYTQNITKTKLPESNYNDDVHFGI